MGAAIGMGYAMEWRDAAVISTVFLVCLAASWIATGRVLTWLTRNAILDLPNERSSHTRPTPRGGGWGVMVVMLPAWGVIGLASGDLGRVGPVLLGSVALVAVSWFDDRRDIGAGIRFMTQIGAVCLGLLALPSDAAILPLPLWLDRTIVAIGWLWMVNLFNFMDGIDGLAGVEATSIGIAFAAFTLLTGDDFPFGLYGAVAAGAAAGFLRWNLHPAKLFMGDVGSVPLGYTLGWLSLTAAARGEWVAACLPPLYFLADATITLLRRAARGERVWRAHREHFYQHAALNIGHRAVTAMVAGADIVLVLLTLVSIRFPVTAALLGGATVATLLSLLAGQKKAVAKS